ncbi:MAG: HD domain-containing protein [Sphingopyxis sp.]
MDTKDRAKFRAMTEGTQGDWDIIAGEARVHSPQGGRRVLDHLRLLDGDMGGYPVDRLTHCLQTATRAHRDGRPESYVVMALLHDIGDTLGAFNHPDVAAAIIKPFVTEEEHWICEHHGIFQGVYFFEYLGLNKDMREQYRDHPYFDACAEFCAKYDQNSFDPDYDTLPLSFFEPMVMRLFERPQRSIYKKALENTP